MSRYIDVEGLNLYDDLFLSEDTINKSGVYVRYRAVENLIKNAPTADVAPVIHAKWIEKNYLIKSYFECSNCLFTTLKDTRYCPHCGAKMDNV